jgi:hypothetical protein
MSDTWGKLGLTPVEKATIGLTPGEQLGLTPGWQLDLAYGEQLSLKSSEQLQSQHLGSR